MNLLLKISGVILLIAGFMLTIKPDFFGKLSTSIDPYQMIEKRVKWGMLIGLGVFLTLPNNWASWGSIAMVLLFSLTLGIILARLTGFVLDGFFIKQLFWLLIELIALFIFGFFYYKQTL